MLDHHGRVRGGSRVQAGHVFTLNVIQVLLETTPTGRYFETDPEFISMLTEALKLQLCFRLRVEPLPSCSSQSSHTFKVRGFSPVFYCFYHKALTACTKSASMPIALSPCMNAPLLPVRKSQFSKKAASNYKETKKTPYLKHLP